VKLKTKNMKTEKIMGAGILAICKKTGRILLCRRSASDQSYPNHWGVFGGTFEDKDLLPKETAKREFKEETKYNGAYEISDEPLDIRSGNFITYYTFVGLFDEEITPSLDHENADYGWFELDILPTTMIPGLVDTIKAKRSKIENIINKLKK